MILCVLSVTFFLFKSRFSHCISSDTGLPHGKAIASLWFVGNCKQYAILYALIAIYGISMVVFNVKFLQRILVDFIHFCFGSCSPKLKQLILNLSYLVTVKSVCSWCKLWEKIQSCVSKTYYLNYLMLLLIIICCVYNLMVNSLEFRWGHYFFL